MANKKENAYKQIAAAAKSLKAADASPRGSPGVQQFAGMYPAPSLDPRIR